MSRGGRKSRIPLVAQDWKDRGCLSNITGSGFGHRSVFLVVAVFQRGGLLSLSSLGVIIIFIMKEPKEIKFKAKLNYATTHFLAPSSAISLANIFLVEDQI